MIRLLSIRDRHTGGTRVAVQLGEDTVLVEHLAADQLLPSPPGAASALEDMTSFIEQGSAWTSEVLSVSARLPRATVAELALRSDAEGGRYQLLAPIPRPRKNVFCVGLNYREHAREGAAVVGRQPEVPAHPVFFSKPPTTVVGHEQDIVFDPRMTTQLDYEAELAVVIGRPGRDVPPREAADLVFGFTIVNDISARDLQRRHGQWFKGKSLDTTLPMGPGIVPADALGNLEERIIRMRLNGRVMQEARLGDMVFDVNTIVSVLSEGMTLEPGDVIATGTPAGVGFARKPPVFLRHGDVLETEIDGLGILRNRVVEHPSDSA